MQETIKSNIPTNATKKPMQQTNKCIKQTNATKQLKVQQTLQTNRCNKQINELSVPMLLLAPLMKSAVFIVKWMGNTHWVLGRAGTEPGGRVRRAELGVGSWPVVPTPAGAGDHSQLNPAVLGSPRLLCFSFSFSETNLSQS